MSKIEKFVFFDGPFSNMDREMEQPYWVVFISTEYDGDISKLYNVNNYDRALALAQSIARDRNIELLQSAVTANW